MTAFLLRQFPGWILEASWQGAALALVVLLVQRLVGKRLAARWRNALWLLVFARLVLPALPEASFSLYNWLPAKPESAPPSLAWSPQFDNVNRAQALSESGMQNAAPSSGVIAAPIAESPAAPFRFPELPYLWLAGVVISAGWSLSRHARTGRRLDRLRTDLPGALADQFEAAKRELRVRRAELIVSEAVGAPCVTGLWKARVILPRDLDQRLSPEDIRMVFLHELAHVKRGDLWLAWFGWLAGTLHWFNPAIHLALALARRDREMACDEWVLGFIPDSKAYGLALVRFLESSQDLPPAAVPGTIGIFEGRAALLQRVRRIAAYHRPTLIGSAVGLALLAAIGALTLTGVTGEKPKEERVTVSVPPQEVLVQAILGDDMAMAQKALDDGAQLNNQVIDVSKAYVDITAPLYLAAEQGRLDLVKLFVTRGANVKPGTSTYTNPLDGALINGFADVAEYLHEHGAATDPLNYAAATGDLDEVTKLIAAGKPKSLDSAANSAAGCNQIAVLTLLLDKGASPAEALKRAVATGAMESMRYLVAHGVDIQKVGYDNLCRAARHGQTGSTAFLLGLKVSPNREKQPGDTSLTEIDPPLNQAAGAGAVGVVKLLLDAGADPNSVVVGDPRMGDTGNTPIDEACGGDHDDILRLLLDHGARLDLMTQRGFTPALFAAYVHAPRCLALLIDRGVDTKAFNSQWKSGIDGFGAIFTGEDANRPDLQRFETTSQIQRGMDTMQVLLDKGILNVNSTGGEGFSLLSIAIVNGQTAWTEMLLNHGANVNTVDDYGGTPLIRAITSMATVKEQRYYAVLDELLARGADPNLGIDNPIVKQDAVPSALKAAICGSGKMDMIRRTVNSLLAHGARFSVPKGSDADKMLLAATAGDADAVGKLLAKGASPNIADSKGWTPLLSAAALHNDAVLKLLVDAGADVNAHDVLGLNAQWFAICRYPDLGEFHLVLDKGADVNADSGYLYYQPDIYLAIMQHDPVLLGELLKRGASPNMLPGDHPERFEPLELAVDQLMENFGDQKRRDVVTMLIAAGANRNPRPAGREGTSLLFYPVSNDMTDMVKFLLAAGVDPKKDQDGGKALSEELARYGSPEMKSLLAGDLPRL